MKEILARTPKQVIIITLLLVVGLGYSIYRAANSFNEQASTPEYQRSPSPAFALPDTSSIVDPQKVNAPRLPDSAYLTLIPQARDLANSLSTNMLTASKLMKKGMSELEASETLSNLLSQIKGAQGRVTSYDGNTIFELTPSGAQNIVTVKSVYDYEQDAQGLPGGSVDVSMFFVEEKDVWLLQSMTASL